MRDHGGGGGAGDGAFGAADVLPAEEELAVEVGDVDGVEVDYFDVEEAGEGEVFEEFAADAAGTDQ